MEDIKIGGKLHSVATEHVVASASEIYDYNKDKNQATINSETDAAFVQIDNEIEALEKQDIIPVDELPPVSDANPKAIYRVVGESSYIDYMVNATGDGWKELATFSFPGIDDVPTLNSENLVKSGGVYSAVVNKVDKVEGKSLIDEEFANGIHYEENPEFVEVKLDGEDKILEAIYKDGTKLLPVGYNVDGVIVKTFSNPEFLAVWLDNANHILFALEPDGNVVFAAGVPRQIIEYVKEIIKPFEELLHFEDNPEYVDVKVDAKGKIAEATRINGTKVLPAGAEFGDNVIKGLDNPEYLKITTDARDKIISSIDVELEDIRYGGINLSEMKRDADCEVLQCGCDADGLYVYTIENNDSTITMEVDDDLNVYEVKDSRHTVEIIIEDTGEVYLEQTIKEI